MIFGEKYKDDGIRYSMMIDDRCISYDLKMSQIKMLEATSCNVSYCRHAFRLDLVNSLSASQINFI